MEGTVIYSGLDLTTKVYNNLQSAFLVKKVASVDESVAHQELTASDVFVMGPELANPVKEIQKITAADPYLSIILLVPPDQIKAIKQTIQFAPFIGKSTLVVAINPELDLTTICRGAVLRTRQKRSFHRFSVSQKPGSNAPKRISAEQLGTFLDYAPIGAILLNDTHGVVTCNEQAKKFFPPLLRVDATLGDLITGDAYDNIKRFMTDGHSPSLKKEITLLQKTMEVTSSEVYNEEGQRQFLLLFNDVTDQRLETNRIQTILEALPQMAWTSNPEGLATYFTQGWYHYTGQTTDEAKGKGWLSVVYEEDVKKMSEQWSIAVRTGKPFQQAARYRNSNGEYRWHLTRASVIRNNLQEIAMWVGTCTDIHDQILLTEELERKVAERTRSLEISNSELEQFAHVSSHDLQEPLRKIRTFAELLKENSYEELNAASRRYVDKISSTAERMSTSLKALLNFTKLHKEEKFVPVDLNQIVGQVLVDLELVIAQKAGVIQVAPLPRIRAVPIQMQQLFYNLISNALKFTRKDNPPVIELSSRRIPEEELLQHPQLNRYKEYHEIIVKDNGVGFDQQHAEKIFTIFQRLHSKTEFEGTGIGLSLVKKVVNNHKGEIRAVSKPGDGARFHVLLPA